MWILLNTVGRVDTSIASRWDVRVNPRTLKPFLDKQTVGVAPTHLGGLDLRGPDEEVDGLLVELALDVPHPQPADHVQVDRVVPVALQVVVERLRLVLLLAVDLSHRDTERGRRVRRRSVRHVSGCKSLITSMVTEW